LQKALHQFQTRCIFGKFILQRSQDAKKTSCQTCDSCLWELLAQSFKYSVQTNTNTPTGWQCYPGREHTTEKCEALDRHCVTHGWWESINVLAPHIATFFKLLTLKANVPRSWEEAKSLLFTRRGK
jgi:hypothetical protein